MQTVLDEINEIVEKSSQFSDEQREILFQKLKKQKEKNGLEHKKNPSPNIEWLKAHHQEYAGNYVALFEGELIAFGRTIKEADTKAKEKGYKKTLLHYIPAEDEEVWGGW